MRRSMRRVAHSTEAGIRKPSRNGLSRREPKIRISPTGLLKFELIARYNPADNVRRYAANQFLSLRAFSDHGKSSGIGAVMDASRAGSLRLSANIKHAR